MNIHKHYWLIKMILRNLDGTKSHYPTKEFIDEYGLNSNNLYIRILDKQTDYKFKWRNE